MSRPGTLYIVATPIGNLSDMVPRAVEILQAVDCIAAEDTRHSGKLLSHCGVQTPMIAYHDHSDETKVQQLVQRLIGGESIALISDAGTPLISDPGYPLVSQARKQGITVSPVPGACAFIAALSASGLPANRFAFEGFLPAKGSARTQALQALVDEPRTLIFYESPHRITDTLACLLDVFGPDRPLVLARELTKAFETFLSGSVEEVLQAVESDPNQRKGEFVLVVGGADLKADVAAEEAEARRVLGVLLGEGLGVKQAAACAARLTGGKKNALYQLALTLNQ